MNQHIPVHTAPLRVDLQLIADMVAPGTRVLDIGCGDGDLLDFLWREKQVDGRGIEISQAGVNAGVTRGLSVIQGNADTDLADFPAGIFDYAILSQTLQATASPRKVLSELVRIGKHAIVSFPNFGHWKVRRHLLLHGRMPVTEALEHSWFDTPNIHLCTISDFVDLCGALDIAIERAITLDGAGQPLTGLKASGALANLFGEQGLFLLTRKKP
ncbi:methionine biosynthesis protein MetW [Oceanibaculum pacificum]|uniref:Methionine biosynthesis protein MetW n=1 Tax=Oceanibaculum pacificum TaxID=580166 RepID=A0A154WF63_9PROT|nr:methionine biosynthesis protein MetW [Oceanibaculum pacificum]KZD12105.1 methionine biosynthesis protein MetW [Oceanibaculum pacificum]